MRHQAIIVLTLLAAGGAGATEPANAQAPRSVPMFAAIPADFTHHWNRGTPAPAPR